MKHTLFIHRTFPKLLGITALALCAAQAQATIIGNVAISPEIGALAKIDNDAQSVDFYCAMSPCVEPNNAIVTFSEGIFESIFGESATLRGFQVADSSADDYLIGHTLWTSGNFSMKIDTLDEVESKFDKVIGFGDSTFFMDDIVIAMGRWSLSLDATGVANFSSTAEAVSMPVPEPGTMVLLGLGLAGIGATRCRAAARQS